jgi:hypothetical protein
MKKFIKELIPYFAKLLLLFLLISVNAFSQNKPGYRIFSENSGNSILSNPDLKKSVNKGIILNIDRSELQNLSENRPLEMVLTIPFEMTPESSKGTVNLSLKRFDILSPNAKIVTRTVNGNEEIRLNDLLVSYSGTIEGIENSFVSISFSNDKVIGIISTENDVYNLGAIKDNRGNETEDYIIYNEKDLKIKNSFSCFTKDNLTTEYTELIRKSISEQKSKDASSTDLYIAEIAVEIDFATYNIYNQNTTAAINYALSIMSAASAIYMKEVNVKLIVPYIRVWSTTDPYTGTNSGDLLDQFASEWTTNQQSVQRTLAHMITRRAGNMGGIAWVNVLCASTAGGNGYAFSNVSASLVPLPTYSWDAMVVSHETGHNFGSNHTHNCSWPGGIIDSCYTPEGGCYNGPQVSAIGTIMSYCHLNGSISLVKGFGPYPKALIRSRSESSGCLYISSREIQIGFPNGGETFRTGESKVVYWGTSLTGNVNIELSTNNGSSWQTIQNNVPAAQRMYDWTVPYGPNYVQSKIRILNSSNPNSGDTTDLSFRILLNLNVFSPLSPPILSRIYLSPVSTETQDFKWSSAGAEPSIRYKFKIKKLATSTEYSYESNNNGTDTVVTFRKSFLDSLANTMGTTGDSVRCVWRAVGYNGIDSLSSTGNFVNTFVRTTVGINLLSTSVPDRFILENNYPNPFNPETNIRFSIPKSIFVELKIYDSKGSEVSTLVNEKLQAGSYQYNFNASNLPSGVYLYRLKTSGFSESKRMILIK